MRTSLIVLFVAGLIPGPAAGQEKTAVPKSPDPAGRKQSAWPQVNPVPVPPPVWVPPPNWVPPPTGVPGSPLDSAAEKAERTFWMWVIASIVGALAVFAGVAARFIVRARANGDFSEDPWVKAQMEKGGKPPD